MEARVRPESRTNLQELVLTQQDVRGMVSVAQALQGALNQGHADLAARMLSGTLVRFKKRGEYRLAGVASLRLPPAVPEPTLAVQGYTDLTLNQLSGTNPFIGDATYEASGRQEAARLAAATAATGGLDLRQSAAAVWRKKVAQGWAPQLPQLLATHGIDRLLHDLEDVAMIEAVAENLEALPPAAPAAPAPAHQQPQVQLPAGLQAPLPATQPALQPAVHRPLLDHVPAAQLELPPHMIPQQQPALQQAGLVHDPDDLPPHLRAQPQQAAQQHMLQPAPPAPHQAALQQVQQQWPHQLWPVVQRQPAPPPLMAAERRRREAEEAARTPVLGGPPDPAGAAWDAAVVAEGQAPAAQQAAGAQLPAEQQQPVVAPAQQVAAVQQAEHQGTVSPKEQPAPQLEEARSLLLQLLEQQQQQQPEEPPPPPPPPQQPAEPLQQQQPQQQQQQQQLLLSHPQQQPVKAEPQQHAEPRAAQPEGQQPAEQQQVKREPLEGQPALQAAQQTAQQTAEQQQRPLPRSISAPAQRLVLGGAAAPSVLLRSISERPPAKQLPPGLQPQSAGGDAQQQPRQEWSVLVCNLGDAFTVEQLELYFRQRYPSVTSAALPRNERTGEPKGFGFVRFARREEQLRAAREMDGHVLPGGRKIGTGLAGTTGGALPPAAQPNAAPASGPAQQQAAAQAAAQQEKTDSPRQQPQQPQGPQQNPKQPPPNGQGEHRSLNGSRGKSPPLIGVPTTAAPAAARPAGAMAGLVPPVAALPTTQLGRQPSSPPAPGAAAPQAMLPMVWPAGMFGAAGMMPLLMQPGRLCYPAMRPGTPGMQGMPAMGMLGPGMFPGMPTGGFGMAAGSGIGTQGGVTARPPPPAAQQLPRPAQQLQHLGSGHSSADVVNLEAAGQPVGGAEPVQAQHSGSGRRSRSRSGRSRSRSRHSGRSRSRSRRSRSPHCSDKRRRWGSPHRRSRSRSPRRRSRSRSPRRGNGGRGPGPALPLWLPPLLTAAVKSVAFDCDGAPFAAIRLLAVLDDLRGERDCVYRAGCNLRHVCDYLHFTRMADVELRPEGPLIMRLHPR